MYHQNQPIMKASMFGMGELPAAARPLADLQRAYGRTYNVSPETHPIDPGATHFVVSEVGSDNIVVEFYDAAGEWKGMNAYMAIAAGGAPTPTRTTGTKTVTETVASWFRPKPSTRTAGKGGGVRPPIPGLPTPMPSPYGPTPAAGAPEWLMPVGILGVVLLASGGLYWASRQSRRRPARVAANRRRGRRRARRSRR